MAEVDYNTEVPRAQIKTKLRKFDNILTVAKTGNADYVCSDEASDYACISAAISDATDKQNIVFLEGAYSINSQLATVGKSFNLIGDKNVTFNLSGVSGDSAVLVFGGDDVLLTSLSTDAAIYSLTVVLNSVTGILAGDLIKIFNTDQWSPTEYPSQTTGEMYEVVGVDSGTSTVTISQPLYRAYLSSNTTIKVYRPAQFNIKNIKFVGTGRENTVGALSLIYGSHSTIKKCTFLNNGKRSLVLASCYDVLVSKNNIRGSAVLETGYGVNIINASAYIKIDKNEIADCRHTVAGGTAGIMFKGNSVGAYEGLNRCVYITDNLLIGANMAITANTIDSHPMTIDYTIIGNKIYPGFNLDSPYDGTYAFGDGTANSIFSNNTIFGGGGVMRRPGAPYSHTLIENNTVENTRGCGLYDGYKYNNHSGCLVDLKIHNNEANNVRSIPGMVGDCRQAIYLGREDYRNVSIEGNTINGCDTDGIYIYEAVNISTGAMKLVINGNIINDIGQYGIFLRRAAVNIAIDAIITNNIISDVNQSGTTYSGIGLIDIWGSRVEGNHIMNRTDTAYAAIKEGSVLGSAVNYNSMNYNTHYGTTNGIVKVGANSEAIGNILITP